MKSKVTLVVVICAAFQGFGVEGLGLVEMISDYAKVVKNAETPTAIIANNDSASAILPSETTPEPVFEYQDFDDFQEEDRSLKQPTSGEAMMKYFNGLISLLALMYKASGNNGSAKSPKHSENHSEPRGEIQKFQEAGKKYEVAQDRFEFPQKKFKYHNNQINDNTVDQQYQPVENYPPYNPLKANTAETYNKDDKKTSYDADLMQYDFNKNSVSDYSHDVEIQQSYSYEIPYENPKPIKSSGYNAETSWTDHDVHPVYHSWMTKNPTENKPANDDNSYNIYITKAPFENKPTHVEDYKPWKSETPEIKPQADTESRQPWVEKPHDFPIYHHDFKDSPPSDHNFEYHEMEHSMDEDRVSKKPYSYYFLGRKLWYVPLLFSVYFIIYIGALVLKSIARHKIQFPEKIWNLHDHHYGKHRRHRKLDDITETYENAVDNMKNKFM